MKSLLTKMKELTRIVLVGQTEAGSAEVQLARDSQLKATNCRWGGSLTPAIPFYDTGTIQSFVMPKKTSCRRQVLSFICKRDLSYSR